MSTNDDTLFVKQSKLPKPLERYDRRNMDNDPKYAQVTRKSNGQFVVFDERQTDGRHKEVLDTICFQQDRGGAIASAKRQQKFFDSPGYPKGRKAVIVILGE